MPEVTYKYVRGQGWLAGYWPEDEPRYFASLDFAQSEMRIMEEMQRRMQDEIFQSYIMPLNIPAQSDGWRYLTIPVQVQRATDYYVVDDPVQTHDDADALEYAITSHTSTRR